MNDKEMKNWVRKNCKFAAGPLIPPASNAGPQKTPEEARFSALENQAFDSFENLKIVKQRVNSDRDAVDAHNPSSMHGYLSDTVGEMESYEGVVMLGGKVFWPQEVGNAQVQYKMPSDLGQQLVFAISEQPPQDLAEMIRGWEELQINPQVMSITPAGNDWYDVLVKVGISGEQMIDDEPDV